jgi:peptidoglycan/xylan/chitin deacetylase (PgdA/CDA1 family)
VIGQPQSHRGVELTAAPRDHTCFNLTFHGIGDPPRALAPGEDGIWISVEWFLAILDDVKDRGDVRLSFDDGNASDRLHGLPALQTRGLAATFFIVAGRLGKPGFISEDDVHELTRAGMTIGCHGMTHSPWRGLAKEALHSEIVESRRILEEISGTTVDTAACPFGAYDRRVLSACRQHGYRHVFTSDDGAARCDGWLQPRNSINQRAGGRADAYVSADKLPLHDAAVRRAKLMVKRWR